MKSLILTCGMIGLALPLSANALNLVQNGSFETTTAIKTRAITPGDTTILPGWVTDNYYSYIVFPGTGDLPNAGNMTIAGPQSGFNNGFTDSPDGGNYLEMYDPTTSSVHQEINGLQAGQVYSLSFYYAPARRSISTSNQPSLTNTMTVSLGNESHSTAPMQVAQGAFGGWIHSTMQFTATGATETLKFLATGGGVASVPPVMLLDGVSLTAAVPEPSTWALMLVGLLGFSAYKTRRNALRDGV